MNPRPFRAGVASVKRSLAATASGEQIKLQISETASFGQFASLKVPGGRDGFSSMRLPKLIESLGDGNDKTVQEIKGFWEERNRVDKNKDFPLTDKELSSVLRWHLRGLTVGAAIRKVRVDCEVTQNCLSR